MLIPDSKESRCKELCSYQDENAVLDDGEKRQGPVVHTCPLINSFIPASQQNG